MSPVFALAIYFVIWWIGMFAVLPFFIRTQAEDGKVVPGTPESAPTRFRLWHFALANTVVATVIFAVVYALIVFDPMGIGEIPKNLKY